MTVTIKTPDDIEKMRIAGRLAAEVLEMIGEHIKPGVTTEELDRICHDYIVNEQKAIPAPLNYKGFPKSICTSINHVVCHGIPNEKPLKEGDILNVDITVIKDGYHGDTSKMFLVGKTPEWADRLCQITQECLYKGIALVKPGARLGDIGEVIQKYAEKNGFSVVREYCGHGIGKVFHEEPQVLHYGRAGTGLELKEGMYKAIELVKPGCRLGDIGEVIQKHAEKNGFSVVREFCGHGIGKVFHEEPQILHYGRAGTGMELKAGMTFTIEPMINQGKADTKVLGDGWTAITKDRKLSAQWEHTLLVTETGYEIFTLRSDDTIARVSA